MTGLADAKVTAGRDEANSLVVDDSRAIGVVHNATFGLADHLAGDDDDVAVEQVDIGVENQSDEVVAFLNFRYASDRHHV